MKNVERFNIEIIEDPIFSGALKQFYVFRGKFEVDCGKPFPIESGKFSITMNELNFLSLRTPPVGGDQDLSNVKGRLHYFVNTKLIKHLLQNPEDLALEFTITKSDVDELLEIDPNRVDKGGWIDIRDVDFDRIFISCGQKTDEEKQLGSEIVQLVKELTSYKGYYAEFQDSLEGVTENIFKALRKSAGFVAVMHKRNALGKNTDEFRGSVWIEQEIAITAFLAQALGESIPVRIYVQKGIKQDGVRGYIIHKPVEFETEKEIIDDLTNWLPQINADSRIGEFIYRPTSEERPANDYSSIIKMVERSNPRSDWRTTYLNSMTISIFNKDTNLRIEQIHQDAGLHNSQFSEKWATKFPDRNAKSFYYDVYYGSSLIVRKVLVTVDGGRSNLPLPKAPYDLQVDKITYQIARIFDNLKNLDEYMDRAGLKVDQSL